MSAIDEMLKLLRKHNVARAKLEGEQLLEVEFYPPETPSISQQVAGLQKAGLINEDDSGLFAHDPIMEDVVKDLDAEEARAVAKRKSDQLAYRSSS